MKDLILLRDLQDARQVQKCNEVVAFRKTHRDNLYDCAPVLVFADWLDEHEYFRSAERLRIFANYVINVDRESMHWCMKCGSKSVIPDGVPFIYDQQYNTRNDHSCGCDRKFKSYILTQYGLVKTEKYTQLNYHALMTLRNCAFEFKEYSDNIFMYFQYMNWMKINKLQDRLISRNICIGNTFWDVKSPEVHASIRHYHYGSNRIDRYLFRTENGFEEYINNDYTPIERFIGHILKVKTKVILLNPIVFDAVLSDASSKDKRKNKEAWII